MDETIQKRHNNSLLRHKGPIRAIALITAIAFFITSLPLDFAWAAKKPLELTRVSSNKAGGSGTPNPETFTLPRSLGHVNASSSPDVLPDATTAGRTVFHIQDSHCDYGCQKSIESIINYLNTEYGVDLALLEGGAGNYDLSVFTDIEDKSRREKLADYFVKEGRVTGSELFGIMNPEKITFKGLEDPKLYFADLNAYRESLQYKTHSEEILKTIEHYLNNLKRNIYSSDLKEFENEKRAFSDGKLELHKYLAFLQEITQKSKIDIKKYENFSTFIWLAKLEKEIDLKTTNFERNKLIDSLSKRLSKTEIETLVRKSLDFKQGNIDSAEFYTYLFKKAKPAYINVKEKCPELFKYKKYVDKFKSLDKQTLFDEVEALETEIAESLFSNNTQKELYALSKGLSILKDLFRASITRGDYDYYVKNKSSLNAKHFLSFIKRKAPKYKINANLPDDIKHLDSYREKTEKFYKIAFKRDHAFLKNIDSAFENKKSQTAIIVTGGFHGKNLEKLLAKKGYSYIGILPKFKKSKNRPYFNLLSGGLIKEEEIIRNAIPTRALAIQSMFSEMGVAANEPDISRLAVILRRATDAGKEFVLEFKDESGHLVRRERFTRNSDDEYVKAEPELAESGQELTPLNLAEVKDKVEAVEIKLADVAMPMPAPVEVVKEIKPTVTDIRELTDLPHQVLTDEELERAYANAENVTALSDFGRKSKLQSVARWLGNKLTFGRRFKLEPTPGERIVENAISKLEKLGSNGITIAERLSALYEDKSRTSPDGKPIVKSRINLIKDIPNSTVGGMGINIAYHEGMTLAQIEAELIHEAIAGCMTGEARKVHELATAVVEAVNDGRPEDATKLLSRDPLENLKLAKIALDEADDIFIDLLREENFPNIGAASSVGENLRAMITVLTVAINVIEKRTRQISYIVKEIERLDVVEAIEKLMEIVPDRSIFSGLGHKKYLSLIGDNGHLRAAVGYLNDFLSTLPVTLTHEPIWNLPEAQRQALSGARDYRDEGETGEEKWDEDSEPLDLWGTGEIDEAMTEEEELDYIVERLLQSALGPDVVYIYDIRVWKRFLITVGLKREVEGRVEAIYTLGTVQYLSTKLAALWNKKAAGTPETFWQAKAAYERSIPRDRWFKAFIYKPFDNGHVEYHENLHRAMFARATESAPLVRIRGDSLFETGTESKHAKELYKIVNKYPEARRAFDKIIIALRKYPSGDLSQEAFSWVASISEYPDFIGEPQLEPGTEEAKYLEEYFRQTEDTASVMIEPAKGFIRVARKYPEIMLFLKEYYERLHAKSSFRDYTPPDTDTLRTLPSVLLRLISRIPRVGYHIARRLVYTHEWWHKLADIVTGGRGGVIVIEEEEDPRTGRKIATGGKYLTKDAYFAEKAFAESDNSAEGFLKTLKTYKSEFSDDVKLFIDIADPSVYKTAKKLKEILFAYRAEKFKHPGWVAISAPLIIASPFIISTALFIVSLIGACLGFNTEAIFYTSGIISLLTSPLGLLEARNLNPFDYDSDISKAWRGVRGESIDSVNTGDAKIPKNVVNEAEELDPDHDSKQHSEDSQKRAVIFELISLFLQNLVFNHPIIAAIFCVPILIRLISAIWRIFFPVSWYLFWGLKSTNKATRKAALENLEDLGVSREEMIKACGKGLKNHDKHTSFREATLDTLNKLNATDEEMSELWRDALGSKDYNTREEAAIILGDMGDKKAVPALIKNLRDFDNDARYRTVEALGKIGDKRAIDGLAERLRIDSKPNIRECAAEALGNFNDMKAIGALAETSMVEPHPGVRQAARNSLMRLGQERTAEYLFDRVKNADDSQVDPAQPESETELPPEGGGMTPEGLAKQDYHGQLSSERRGLLDSFMRNYPDYGWDPVLRNIVAAVMLDRADGGIERNEAVRAITLHFGERDTGRAEALLIQLSSAGIRLMAKKLEPTPSYPEFRPIKQLTWEDEEEVLGHFKALLVELGWPVPRVLVQDNKVVAGIRVRPLNIESLKTLAEDESPAEYYRKLLTTRNPNYPDYFDIYAKPFLKEFGIFESWVIWFRYRRQLESIREYINTLPKNKTVKILVHGTYNGEDAYAIAVMLDYVYPDRTFKIVGADFIKPNISELHWVAIAMVPDFLKKAIPRYFSYKTNTVVALKDDFKKLVALRQGDIKDPGSFGRSLDIVVVNGVLGQSITKADDIKQSVENAWASLKPGGRLYVDNSAYVNEDLQTVKRLVEDIIREHFVETGKFTQVGMAYKKIDTTGTPAEPPTPPTTPAAPEGKGEPEAARDLPAIFKPSAETSTPPMDRAHLEQTIKQGQKAVEAVGMIPPCTVVVAVKSESDRYSVLSECERFANKLEVSGRRMARQMNIENESGPIKFLVYIDDGTVSDENLERLDKVVTDIEGIKAANPQETVFTWILKDDRRKGAEEYQARLASLRELGTHIAALQGEYVPAVPQMHIGLLMARLIDFKKQGNGDEGSVSATVNAIIESINRLTRRNYSSLKDELQLADIEKLSELFNGSFVLILPDIELEDANTVMRDFRRCESQAVSSI